MIDSISGNIGFLEPLETLADQFVGSAIHQQKLKDFAEEFGGWRHCRGDGNCFYRAFAFSLVEAVIRQDPTGLGPVIQIMRESAAGEADKLLNFLAGLCILESNAALEKFYRDAFTDVDLDVQLVRVIRLVCAAYLSNNEEVEFNGLPLNVYVEASHGMSLQQLRDNEVLVNGTEAESVTLMLAPMAFDVQIEIIQLDRSDTAAQRYKVPEGSAGEVVATLLFKPGHYDIFYPKSVAEAILALQHACNIRVDCQQKKACVICMDEEDNPIPLPCGCAYHGDCLESYKASGAGACAVCQAPF